ncbi:SecDF P1 head subdomain-containing protein [Actinomadura atramentaria]|uniref:SecDF P1 head subdomain-containing protein n=1 Tax=Actinomadura atramentaria TaxID=1990 RepID=UPI0005278E75|nr:hypothetical protein [Actinomadura atramentaria]
MRVGSRRNKHVGAPKVASAPQERSRPAAPPAPPDEAARRRERSQRRQREAADLKRARRRSRKRPRPAGSDRAAREHRSALVVMVMTLGLLIAAVAVTGGVLASRMREKPITLASPLLVYPVTQTTPGQCPNGTQGITGTAVAGLTCYQLAQGITIRKVTELRVQKARQSGAYDVAMTLRSADRDAFAKLTRAMVGRDLAFVVGTQLITTPRVDMPISDGKIVITGPPNRDNANLLARQLRGR